MKFKTLAIAVLAATVLAFGTIRTASAVVTDVGTLDVTTTGVASFGDFVSRPFNDLNPFSDIYNFRVNDSAAITFAFEINNSQGLVIDVATGSSTPFFAQLFADALPIGSGVFSIQEGLNSPNFSLVYAGLQPGVLYSVEIIGNVLSQKGGTYTFSANLSQVPLPAAAWLFLSALAGLATTVRVRRARSETA